MINYSQQLEQGLAITDTNTAAFERAVHWLELLERWNRTINLTAIPEYRRPAQFVLTSIAAIPYLNQGMIADVGSGNGVPGVPLAIFAPDNQYELIDSNSKKIRFLNQCCTQLKLDNVKTLHNRVDSLTGQCYDTIISRAFADLKTFLSKTYHLADRKTRWLAFKHNKEQAKSEIAEASKVSCKLHHLQIPTIDQPVFLIQAQLT